jgi:hypothetical protein
MPTTTEASYAVTYRLRCEHCKRDQSMAMGQNLSLGQVIQHAPGGGDYGICRFCKRSGLKVIDKIMSDRVP